MKVCNKCKELFDISFYNKSKTGKDGLNSICKNCSRERSRLYRQSDIGIDNYRKYSKSENRKRSLKKYSISDKGILSNKKYMSSEKRQSYFKKYQMDRLNNDTLFKLSKNIRGLIRASFKNSNNKKDSKTIFILGCEIDEFKKYIESKFEHWMNWNNYGLYNATLNYGWDLDHIIPLSSAKSKEELILLNHYTNLQPLCSFTNRNIKRNKIK